RGVTSWCTPPSGPGLSLGFALLRHVPGVGRAGLDGNVSDRSNGRVEPVGDGPSPTCGPGPAGSASHATGSAKSRTGSALAGLGSRVTGSHSEGSTGPGASATGSGPGSGSRKADSTGLGSSAAGSGSQGSSGSTGTARLA